MNFVCEKNMGVLGRIVIPEGLRESHGLNPGTPIGIYQDGPRIILQSHSTVVMGHECFFCGIRGGWVAMKNGKGVCARCIGELQDKAKNEQ